MEGTDVVGAAGGTGEDCVTATALENDEEENEAVVAPDAELMEENEAAEADDAPMVAPERLITLPDWLPEAPLPVTCVCVVLQ